MRPILAVDAVKTYASQVHTGFEIIPNYTAFGTHAGDLAFQMQTGVYFVGQAFGEAPSLPLNEGDQARIGDIVGMFRKKWDDLVDVFWMCCRAAPQNSNNTVEVNDSLLGMVERPQTTGLRPSQVKALGGHWR